MRLDETDEQPSASRSTRAVKSDRPDRVGILRCDPVGLAVSVLGAVLFTGLARVVLSATRFPVTPSAAMIFLRWARSSE
jgi:hypothetical protein